jgi:glycosyltransferase involved in cell wall biosynthesis
MKIVHILPQLVKAGAERVVVDLANHAAAAGHEVSVIAGRKADETLLRDELSAGVEVRYLSERADARWEPYFRLLPWLLRNRGWIFSRDIVHCHLTFGSVFGSIIQAMRALRRGRRPAVVESYQAVASPVVKPFARWLHSRLAAGRDAFVIMADDGYWGDFLRNRPQLPSRIIPNGIAVPGWEPIAPEARAEYRRSIGIPESCRWVVLTLGRIVTDRQPWVFPPIFAEIAKILGPEVHFVYAGEGPLRPQVEALVAQHRLEGQVHITGLVREPRVPLSITDVYVTLNVGPVTGIAALEAVFFGLPVIAVQIFKGYEKGGADWIPSGTDPKALAAEIVGLLRSQEARDELAARQHAYAWDHLRVEAMAAAYGEVYAEAIQAA